MAAARKPGTLAENVYEATRADILACRLVPGVKIKINDLCARFDVSLGAVREALSRLSAERLVLAQAQRGYSVAPVSVEDLKDLTAARVEIESVCLARAIANATVEWETMIVAATHRLSRTPERAEGHPSRVSERWLEAHEAYHDALVGACDSLHLLRIRKQLYQQGERYRLLAISLGRGMRSIDAEHKRLAKVVLQRDLPAAMDVARRHISQTADIIVPAMSRLNEAGAAPVRPARKRELSA